MKDAKVSSKKKPPKKAATAEHASQANRTNKRASEDVADSATKEIQAKDSGDSKHAPVAASPPQPPIVDKEPTLPATHGKVGVFGGPKDRGMKPDDKLALPTGPHGVYERVRTLNPKSFYCAMRWNYHVEHLTPEEVRRWWANKKLLVSAKNGNAVVVRAADYGPHENTGLDIGISPGAADALGVEVGDEVDIALADPKSPLGKQ